MINKKICILIFTVSTLFLTGCYSNTNSVLDNQAKTQLQQRTYQSRAFETTDRTKTLRTVIATLQDLDFVIDKADDTLGAVSATKFVRNRTLQMTISVRPRGAQQLVVRANAQYGIYPVEDPKAYQDFFVSLSKAMFLDAQEIS